MWAFTSAGFFSIVEHKDGHGHLLVRSRVRDDLVRLADSLNLSHRRIKNDPTADYHWRMKAPRHLITKYMGDSVKGITYTTSVKDHLDLGEPQRHSAMLDVWTAMMRLQRPVFAGRQRTFGFRGGLPIDEDTQGDWTRYSPSYFHFDDDDEEPDDAALAELDDETDWFLEDRALDDIRDVLDGQPWGPDSLERIAGILRDTGRDVTEAA